MGLAPPNDRNGVEGRASRRVAGRTRAGEGATPRVRRTPGQPARRLQHRRRPARRLDNAGFGWATSHVLRKTTASVLDAGGLSAREIADQLGHARPSITMDRYMGRKVASDRGATVLESIA
jgi:integrase